MECVHRQKSRGDCALFKVRDIGQRNRLCERE
jgi:hypothetical protein